jgi:hypothetical protein
MYRVAGLRPRLTYAAVGMINPMDCSSQKTGTGITPEALRPSLIARWMRAASFGARQQG